MADSEESASSWLGGWFQIAKEKSTSAFELVKKDLAEFTSVMQTDTTNAVCVTKCTIQENLKAENAAAAKTKVKQGFSSFLEEISKALTIEPESKSQTPENSAAVFDRAQIRLQAMQIDPGTYCNEPTGTSDKFEEWLKTFDAESKKGDISELLVSKAEVRALYTNLVPTSVSHAKFWQRYFYKIHQLQLDEARKQALMKRAEESGKKEDSLSWDDEEEWSIEEDSRGMDNDDPAFVGTNLEVLHGAGLEKLKKSLKQSSDCSETVVNKPSDFCTVEMNSEKIAKEQEFPLTVIEKNEFSTYIKSNKLAKQPDSSLPAVEETTVLGSSLDEKSDKLAKQPDSPLPAVEETTVLGSLKESDKLAKQPDSPLPAVEETTVLGSSLDEKSDKLAKQPDSPLPAVEETTVLGSSLDEKSNKLAKQPDSPLPAVEETTVLGSLKESDKIAKQPDSSPADETAIFKQSSTCRNQTSTKTSSSISQSSCDAADFPCSHPDFKDKDTLIDEKSSQDKQKLTLELTTTLDSHDVPDINIEYSSDKSSCKQTDNTDSLRSELDSTDNVNICHEHEIKRSLLEKELKTTEKGDMIVIGSLSGSPASDSSENCKDITSGAEDEWEQDFDVEVTDDDLKAAQMAIENATFSKDFYKTTLEEEDWENWE